jgi:hypothetical protein
MAIVFSNILINRLLKKAHLRRCPPPSSLRRTSMYASFLRVSGAWYLDLFEQPVKKEFFRILLIKKREAPRIKADGN